MSFMPYPNFSDDEYEKLTDEQKKEYLEKYNNKMFEEVIVCWDDESKKNI